MGSMPESVRGGSPEYAPGVELTLSLKGQVVQRYTFDKPELVIGRDPYADVYVDNPGVSRQHFKIVRGDTGEYRVVDSGSSNGTYLNDRPIKVATLRDGDVVQFAKYALLVNIDELIGSDDGARKHSVADGATMMLSPSEVRQMVADTRTSPRPAARLTVVTPGQTAPSEPAPATSGLPSWVLWAIVAAVAAAAIVLVMLTAN